MAIAFQRIRFTSDSRGNLEPLSGVQTRQMRSRFRSIRGLTLTALLGLACDTSPPKWVSGSPWPEESPADSYFPSGALDGDPRWDSFFGKWFSKHLAAAGEPALPWSPAVEAYRFIHLPSFHHPVIIRVQEHAGVRFLVVKELDGAGGYESGPILVERYRRLTSREWRWIQEEIAAMRFWPLPKHPCASRDHPDDGYVWILEGKQSDEYQVVRWHWAECSVCLELVRLADVELRGVGVSLLAPASPVPPPPAFEW